MRFLRLGWRVLLVLATFAGVGLWVSSAVTRLGMAGNAPVAQVRLSSAMAGLFAGGAAALLVTLVVLLTRKHDR